MKIVFRGVLKSVQPRIRLIRSFDEASHNYLGYALLFAGVIGEEQMSFSVGIGKAAQAKHLFRVGDEASGECLPVADKRLETVAFYKVSKLKKVGSADIAGKNRRPGKILHRVLRRTATGAAGGCLPEHMTASVYPAYGVVGCRLR